MTNVTKAITVQVAKCGGCGREVYLRAGRLDKHQTTSKPYRLCPFSSGTFTDSRAGIRKKSRDIESHYVRLAKRQGRRLTPAERADLNTLGIRPGWDL